MSVSYFVRYDIAVPDLPGFLERYRKVHVPLVVDLAGPAAHGAAHAARLAGPVSGEPRQGGADGAARVRQRARR